MHNISLHPKGEIIFETSNVQPDNQWITPTLSIDSEDVNVTIFSKERCYAFKESDLIDLLYEVAESALQTCNSAELHKVIKTTMEDLIK